jgi:hypothetical protein
VATIALGIPVDMQISVVLSWYFTEQRRCVTRRRLSSFRVLKKTVSGRFAE